MGRIAGIKNSENGLGGGRHGNNIFNNLGIDIHSFKHLPVIMRQRRHFVFDVFDVCVVEDNWRQVGVGHVAVIFGIFFAALGEGFLLGVVPAARFLGDFTALFQNFDLAVNFVVYRFFDGAEAVQVFGFGACAELFSFADANINVEAHVAVVQIGVTYVGIAH